jgi:hypothetical protein
MDHLTHLNLAWLPLVPVTGCIVGAGTYTLLAGIGTLYRRWQYGRRP